MKSLAALPLKPKLLSRRGCSRGEVSAMQGRYLPVIGPMRLMFRCALVSLALAAGVGGCSKPPVPPPTVAVLMLDDLRKPIFDGLVQGLSRYGYYADRNITYVARNAKTNTALLPELARELSALHPAVICPLGNQEAEVCIKLARHSPVPIVFIGVSNPYEHGLAKGPHLPLPGTTGVETGYAIRMAKRLQLITIFFRSKKTVTVLFNPVELSSRNAMEECMKAGPGFGLTIRPAPVRSTAELISFSDSLEADGHEIILSTPSSLLDENRRDVTVPAAVRARIPLFGLDREACADGAVIAYGPSTASLGIQGARLVEKVMLGSKPDMLPIELPEDIELSINLKIADQIGLGFSRDELLLADYIIR